MDYDTTEHLIEKAVERYGAKRCRHEQTTLVQHEDAEFGWFACYQCDRCGQITQNGITSDDLDRANDAPLLDIAMYEQVITERLSQETLIKTMTFFGKAAR